MGKKSKGKMVQFSSPEEVTKRKQRRRRRPLTDIGNLLSSDEDDEEFQFQFRNRGKKQSRKKSKSKSKDDPDPVTNKRDQDMLNDLAEFFDELDQTALHFS